MSDLARGLFTTKGAMGAEGSRKMMNSPTRIERRLIMMIADALAWAVALTTITTLRWSVEPPHEFARGLAGLIAIAIICQMLVGWFAFYRLTWRLGSFEEFSALSLTTGVAAGVVIVADAIVFRSSVPASSALGGSAMAFGLMVGVRGGLRFWRDLHQSLPEGTPGAIIFGAGDAGQQTIDLLVSNEHRPYWPVALLDDDPKKQNFRARHLGVLGTRDSIGSAAEQTDAEVMIIAVPSADSALIRILTTSAEEVGLRVLVLPPVSEMIAGRVAVTDIQPVTEADLLGRRVINTKVESIAHYLTGRRVLVTGAGGSIGSELCRQITRYGPSSLIMLDRDESGLQEVQLSIEGRAMLDSRNIVVCDIRDTEGLEAVFAEHSPEVVFHAAALKHLPLLEMWPREAYKTNVIGTLNVLEAAKHHGVKTFVNISTDKAANCQCVLGYSKRIAERLTAGFAELDDSSNYLSVRFGNVLGSRGSVLRTFWSQVENGGPITVTHPEVTRYFMTVEEAVQLMIQAGALSDGGGVLILDMGTPVKIDEVARRLAREAPIPIEVVYTGLRPGEKLHEDLVSDDEILEATAHPLISRAAVAPLACGDLVPVVSTDPIGVVSFRLAELAVSSPRQGSDRESVIGDEKGFE